MSKCILTSRLERRTKSSPSLSPSETAAAAGFVSSLFKYLSEGERAFSTSMSASDGASNFICNKLNGGWWGAVVEERRGMRSPNEKWRKFLVDTGSSRFGAKSSGSICTYVGIGMNNAEGGKAKAQRSQVHA